VRILAILFTSFGLLCGCSPIKKSVTNEYQINAYSIKQFRSKPVPVTLMVMPPEAVAAYQTSEMLYVTKPYQVASFAKNAWVDPPADMLYPLLVQSLQRTGYFKAVASGLNNEVSDYRLDTQLLKFEQNFLQRPSVMEFSAKIVLTRISDAKLMASQIISQHIPCPMDTPYGGVIAANRATFQFTAAANNFVIAHIKHD